MRFYNNQLEPIREALIKIFFENTKDHMAVAFMLENNKKWGSKDRKLVSKCVYDIVRYWRRYWFSIDTIADKELVSYQKLIALWLALQTDTIETIFEMDVTEIARWKQQYLDANDIVIQESISDELNQLAKDELGEAIWQREIHALNFETSLILRVNTSKAKIDRVAESLLQEGIATERIETIPTALKVLKRVNLKNSPTYNQGVFEIQDASSQLIVPFLEIKPDTVVIDACAGAGGKTLHIADALRNSGRIIAMDVEQNKLKELKRRAERNRFTKIDTYLIQNDKSLSMYAEKADRLLLDVPCTGVGVLRRNADDKYRISKESLAMVLKKQEAILQSYPIMLKKGGIMVYATCSIFPSENQKQIANFLAKNPAFSLIEEQTIFPSISGFDGFYMAKIQKK